jgi:hypothetical protein
MVLAALFVEAKPTAPPLLVVTGAIQNLGCVYAVSRHDLMDLVERFINTDDVNRVLNNLLDKAPEPLDSKPIKVEIPEQCKYVRLNELPNNIVIEAGKLEIKGEGLTIIQSLGLLARALETDCDLLLRRATRPRKPTRSCPCYSAIYGGALIPDGSPVQTSQGGGPAITTDEKGEHVTFVTGPPE